MGHRSTEWCPRCGTSLSQHELTQSGVYQDRADPSLFVRFPLLDRDGEYVVVWTTTPWTLPANVAAAVHPGRGVRAARERRVGRGQAVPRRHVRRARSRAASWSGWRYRGPFDDLTPGSEVEHRVIPWDDVTMDQGTGIVHIAPGCGGEDFELSKVHDLPVLTPVDESGRFYDDYGWLHGLSTTEAADQIIGRLGETGFLVEAGLYTHAYPHCWRCDTPLIFRLSDDWFISVEEIRPTAARGERQGAVGARVHGQAHGRLAAQHGRLEHLAAPLLRAAAAVLSVLVRPPERRRLEGRAAASARRRASTSSRSCAGRGSTASRSAARRAARRSTRIPEVGDVWLDAGIVPFSTLGWENDEWVPEGYATGAARGLTTADAARPRVLGAVVSRRLGHGDARADPALVLLAVLHVGRARRPLAVQARARLREDARRARPRDARLVGEHDPGRGRLRRRWAPT